MLGCVLLREEFCLTWDKLFQISPEKGKPLLGNGFNHLSCLAQAGGGGQRQHRYAGLKHVSESTQCVVVSLFKS